VQIKAADHLKPSWRCDKIVKKAEMYCSKQSQVEDAEIRVVRDV
jgi:hypothetical protein